MDGQNKRLRALKTASALRDKIVPSLILIGRPGLGRSRRRWPQLEVEIVFVQRSHHTAPVSLLSTQAHPAVTAPPPGCASDRPKLPVGAPGGPLLSLRAALRRRCARVNATLLFFFSILKAGPTLHLTRATELTLTLSSSVMSEKRRGVW